MKSALLRALGFALAVVLVYLTFVWTRVGQQLDAAAFIAAGALASSPFGVVVDQTRTTAVVALAAAATIAGVFALIQRRLHAVSIALLLVVSSAGIAHALRAELPRPYLGEFAYKYNTLPSGHAASAAAIVVALLVLLPRGLASRTMNFVAILVITAAALASVLSFAHRPSDVLASVFIVGCLGSLLRLFRDAASPPLLSSSSLWAVGATVAAALLYMGLLASVGVPRALFAVLAPAAAIFAAAAWVLLLAVPVRDPEVAVSFVQEHGPRRRLLTPPSG
jgi:hypothetical protein